MSFLCFSYLAVLALCAAWVNVINAQNMTFVDGFFDTLTAAGFSNYSALTQQVTNAGLLTFAQLISKEPPMPVTIFLPEDSACEPFATASFDI